MLMSCCQQGDTKPPLNSASLQPAQDLWSHTRSSGSTPALGEEQRSRSMVLPAQLLCDPENSLSSLICSTILRWFQANDLFMLPEIFLL